MKIPDLKLSKNINAHITKPKGELVWDYNALRVFRLSSKGDADDIIYVQDTWVNKSGYLLSKEGKYEKVLLEGQEPNIKYNIAGKRYTYEYILEHFNSDLNGLCVYQKQTVENAHNALIDLDTDLLDFDITRPLQIETQQSYDGSVNLIINDGYHTPKLINSRFSPIGNNEYQIVDRLGENDTNIYGKDTFNTDTALYKISNSVIKIEFNGVYNNGALPVGNYVFYFTFSDADGNETDFVGESSIVTCHKGALNDPFSIEGGLADENSNKAVSFTISNIDSSYSYVNVYYSRATSDTVGVRHEEVKRINRTYEVYNSRANVYISGLENTSSGTEETINPLYNLVNAAKTSAICQNMLFLGNVKKPNDYYNILHDLALHFYPSLTKQSIGYVTHDYKLEYGKDKSCKYPGEYYNVHNIYNYTGYWNGEIYRMGIVYIFDNNSLSPVFNIRGCYELEEEESFRKLKPFKLDSYTENNIQQIYSDLDTRLIDKDNYINDEINNNENDKGVFRINWKGNQITATDTFALGIKMNFDGDIEKNKESVGDSLQEVLEYCGIKGYFFVRQKRLATCLAQAITQGYDRQSHLPMLYANNQYITEGFLNSSRQITNDFNERIKTTKTGTPGVTAFCPEYDQSQDYFNSIFTSSKFTIIEATDQYKNSSLIQDEFNFYPQEDIDESKNELSVLGQAWIQAVPENTQAIKNYKRIYSSEAGNNAEAWRFNYLFVKNKSTGNHNLVRGLWGPYLGIEYVTGRQENLRRINIMVPDYSRLYMTSYFLQRYEDSSPYYAITDRQSIYDELPIAFRGDCYICNYSHRMNRNFQDPSFPLNDQILDEDNWKDTFDKDDKKTSMEQKLNIIVDDKDENRLKFDSSGASSKYLKINRGDVNAVKMGHWFTFKIMASKNLSMRSTDSSNITEYALTHKPRGFYPLYSMSTEGSNKMADSGRFNDGYGSTTSQRVRFNQPEVPAIKNIFRTRVMYSNPASSDSFKNNLRVFEEGNYYDYPTEYGQIVKLVEFMGNLICVFEHGIGIIAVNEKAIAAQAESGLAYIKTNKVISDLKVISDQYGSQWTESVIETPTGVYGIDTVAKKIWKTDGSSITILSDLKIQKFLVDNITIGEMDTDPIIGIRNVKTHYNAYKQDVMFTFYNKINSLDDVMWNICYSEVTKSFSTLYSWIPSYSSNIDKIYFSFDREMSKNIALLNDCEHIIKGPHIKKEDNIYPIEPFNNIKEYYYQMYVDNTYRGKNIYHLLYDDRTENDENPVWKIVPESGLPTDKQYSYAIYYNGDNNIEYIPVGVVLYDTINGQKVKRRAILTTFTVCTKEYENTIQNYFWKHGQAGLMQLDQDIKPTHWYGKQHPFEFEFIVGADTIQYHKIYDTLQMIANKATPESFHFEIVGEVYNFAYDKQNMFYRQEALRHVYQYNGSDLKYNPEYLKLDPKQEYNKYDGYYRKSFIFPLRVVRQDTINEVYDTYKKMTSSSLDYGTLAGSEITYDKFLNEFRVATHMPVYTLDGYQEIPITEEQFNYYKLKGIKVYKDNDGNYYKLVLNGNRIGNAQYVEDQWKIQIPPINFVEKNEESWTKPPINFEYNPDWDRILPEQVELPNELSDIKIEKENWGEIKQARQRDKYLRVKVRYSGKDLAVISGIITNYTISYK